MPLEASVLRELGEFWAQKPKLGGVCAVTTDFLGTSMFSYEHLSNTPVRNATGASLGSFVSRYVQ